MGEPDLPRRFGRFWLLEQIGEGGMARIYRAAIGPDAETYSFDFALKVMRPELAQDPSLVEMFLIEEYVVRMLSHPALIRVFESGRVDETPYIAMELVRGADLERLMHVLRARRMPIPKDLAVLTVMQVLKVLDYIWRARSSGGRPLEIVHRDITPSNIYVTREGEVKIGDFGVARVAILEPAEHAQFVKGKVPYLPPEAFGGAPPSPQLDLWSLAVTFFELLVGSAAYENMTEEELVAGGPDLSRLSASRLPAPDPELAELLGRWLHPKPQKRPPDAATAYRELRAYAHRHGLLLDRDNLARFVAATVDLRAVAARAELPMKDSLTGAYSASYLSELLQIELERATRYARNFSLVLFDIDGFARVNTLAGVGGGDAVLRLVLPEILRRKAGLRTSDLVARRADDRFVVFLPETTLEGGLVAAERVRRAFVSTSLSGIDARLTEPLTVSAGVASYPTHGRTIGSLLEAADLARLVAKRGGHNRVVAADAGFEVLKSKVAAATATPEELQRFERLRAENELALGAAAEGRTQARVRAPVEVEFQSGTDFAQAFVADLGAGGMRLVLEQEVEQGAELDLRVRLPDANEVVAVRAEVVWVGQGGEVGLRFVNLSAALRERIAALVARTLGLGQGPA